MPSGQVFFLATAPSSTEHHVNVSPRAPGSSVVVVDSHTVAIADLTGSGSETAAHILQNSRITIMFVNLLDGPPIILRLFGLAQILLPAEVEPGLLHRLPSALTADPGFRAVYVVTCHRITASCGYSMPVMALETFRTALQDFTRLKGCEGMRAYWEHKNSYSIDGLPSLNMLHCADADADAPVVPSRENGYVFGKRVSAAAAAAATADSARTGARMVRAARAAARLARASAARTLANAAARGHTGDLAFADWVGGRWWADETGRVRAQWTFVAGAVAFGLLQLAWLRAIPVLVRRGCE
jgi:hypothetical protein